MFSPAGRRYKKASSSGVHNIPKGSVYPNSIHFGPEVPI